MALAHYVYASSSAPRNHDGWFIAGYAISAVITLAALYFASGGPGNGEAALAAMVAMP